MVNHWWHWWQRWCFMTLTPRNAKNTCGVLSDWGLKCTRRRRRIWNIKQSITHIMIKTIIIIINNNNNVIIFAIMMMIKPCTGLQQEMLLPKRSREDQFSNCNSCLIDVLAHDYDDDDDIIIITNVTAVWLMFLFMTMTKMMIIIINCNGCLIIWHWSEISDH